MVITEEGANIYRTLSFCRDDKLIAEDHSDIGYFAEYEILNFGIACEWIATQDSTLLELSESHGASYNACFERTINRCIANTWFYFGSTSSPKHGDHIFSDIWTRTSGRELKGFRLSFSRADFTSFASELKSLGRALLDEFGIFLANSDSGDGR